jgi:UDP-4-amino-4,6-dideoxy-N-acetyl-beta-L-altrosamine N-acetyltransferase
MNIAVSSLVTLRPLELSDLSALHKYRNDPEVTQQLGGFSTGYSHSDLQDWFESHRNRSDEVMWCVSDVSSDTCLGHVGFYEIDFRLRSAEFGILLGAKDYWGKGIGTSVSRAVVEFGFRQLNLHRIHLSVVATNERAVRLYERLGFSREGCLRHGQFRNGDYVDVIVMGLLETEW